MKAIRVLSVALLAGMLLMFAACSDSASLDGSGDITTDIPAPNVDGTVDGSGNGGSTDTGVDTASTCTPAAVQIIKPSAASIAHPIVGQAYQRAFRGQGGSCDGLVWSIEGTLPAGLDLVPDATSKYKVWIKGTPTAAGDGMFSLTAKDADDDTNTDSFSVTLTVDPASTQPPPGGTPGGTNPGVIVISRAPMISRSPVAWFGASGDLSLDPIVDQAIDITKGPFQTVPLTLTAKGGRAPYKWSADKDGNSSHWLISNIANISTCGADGSNTCTVKVAGFSPVLSDVTKDPETDISFTVTDADGKTAPQTAHFTATYPDVNGTGYNVDFSQNQAGNSVLKMNNHVEFFLYWKLGDNPDADIVATVDSPGDPFDANADPVSYSLPVKPVTGYENHLSQITAITIRLSPPDLANGCHAYKIGGISTYAEVVPAGTALENDYWKWELKSDLGVRCEGSWDSDFRTYVEKKQGYRGVIVESSSTPLLVRKAPWWFVSGS